MELISNKSYKFKKELVVKKYGDGSKSLIKVDQEVIFLGFSEIEGEFSQGKQNVEYRDAFVFCEPDKRYLKYRVKTDTKLEEYIHEPRLFTEEEVTKIVEREIKNCLRVIGWAGKEGNGCGYSHIKGGANLYWKDKLIGTRSEIKNEDSSPT